MENIKRHKNIILITTALVLISIMAVLVFKFQLLKHVNITEAQDYINSYGRFSVLIFILVFVLRTFLIICPYSIMVVLGGSLFGHLFAFAYSMIATFISATLAFYIGRFAGIDMVKKLLKGKAEKVDLNIEKHGFKIILLMRVSIIFPFDIVNYAAGLSKVKYRDFILATMLGVAPEVFSLTYFGSSLGNPFSYKFLFSLGLVVVTFIVPLIYKKVKAKKSS